MNQNSTVSLLSISRGRIRRIIDYVNKCGFKGKVEMITNSNDRPKDLEMRWERVREESFRVFFLSGVSIFGFEFCVGYFFLAS